MLHDHFKGQKIVVVGAGLAGTLAAIMLAQRGAVVEVIEKQKLAADQAFSNRRSFNITVSSRGQAALALAGIWEDVKAVTIPITGRMCHIGLDSTPFPYSEDRSVALHGAQRADVNKALLDAAARYPQISMRFGAALSTIDKTTGAISIRDVDTQEAEIIDDADFVIGADGIYSQLRKMMHIGERADYAQRFLDHGYREILIPASDDPENPWQMDPNALHVWPRGEMMMFALPNPDGSFMGNFIYPMSQDKDIDVPGKMSRIFAEQFPDVAPLVPDVEERLRQIPPSYFPTQRNSMWSHADKFVLLGDAAHATVPFYGQGMNSAFESVVELIKCLETHAPAERAQAFQTYQANRKPHTDAVADLSMENFEELRSNFRRRMPQARRRVDVLLHKIFPKSYIPLHILISHSQVNYRTAIDMCEARDRKLRLVGLDLLVGAFAGWQLAVDGMRVAVGAAGMVKGNFTANSTELGGGMVGVANAEAGADAQQRNA